MFDALRDVPGHFEISINESRYFGLTWRDGFVLEYTICVKIDLRPVKLFVNLVRILKMLITSPNDATYSGKMGSRSKESDKEAEDYFTVAVMEETAKYLYKSNFQKRYFLKIKIFLSIF